MGSGSAAMAGQALHGWGEQEKIDGQMKTPSPGREDCQIIQHEEMGPGKCGQSGK